MDFMSVGLDVLELAMQAGTTAVEQIGQILQTVGEPENPPISCELCRCDW